MNFAFLVVGFLVSVLLLTTSTVTNSSNSFYNQNYFKDPTYQTLPYFEWLYKVYAPHNAYAQDEEEDEEDSSKDKDEEEDEEDTGGKDNEDEESNNSSDVATEEETGAAIAEPLEQLSDQYLDVTETKQELQEQAQQVLTEEQQVKEELNNILVAGNWTNPNPPKPEPQEQPIFNLTNDHITTQQQQPIFKNLTNYYHQTLLDPSCNCTNPAIEPPNQSVLPPTVSPPPQGLQQIIINPASVKSFDSWGEIKDPRYTNFYTVKNTIDNKIDENSFWSQYGQSGFNIELYPEALQNYEVCHAEVVVHNPKSAQSTLAINSQNYTGILDNTTEKVDFNTCMKNVDEIGMSFDSDKKYTSIGELKLFGKLVNQPQVPQPQPTPGTGNTTKIEIKNSNAIIDIINSTVTFKFDPHSAQATNYNVITIPTNPTNGATK